jgi:hypothetical protein
MNRRLLLAGLLLASLSVAGSTYQNASKPLPRYEYKTADALTYSGSIVKASEDVNKVLDAYTQSGWELVTVERYDTPRFGEQHTRLYFRRQK